MADRLRHDRPARDVLERYAPLLEDFYGSEDEVVHNFISAMYEQYDASFKQVRAAAEVLAMPLKFLREYATTASLKFSVVQQWLQQLLDGKFAPIDVSCSLLQLEQVRKFEEYAQRSRVLIQSVLDFVPDVPELVIDPPKVILMQPIPLRDFERESDVQQRIDSRNAATDADEQKKQQQIQKEHALMAREDRKSELLRILTNEQKTARAKERMRVDAELKLMEAEAAFSE